jgi:hypothetical protein
LTVPLLIALVNSGGILFFLCGSQWRATRLTMEDFEPRRGETIFLDRTTLQWDGIFDRFNLRQKYVNPEETDFFRYPGLRRLTEDPTTVGVNFFFSDDLPSLPEFPLFLSGEDALPWLRASDGLAPVEEYREGRPVMVWKSYKDRIRFFMRVDRRPEGDLCLTLKGRSYAADGLPPNLTVVAFVDNRSLGVWNVAQGTAGERSFVIPRQLLEDSLNDDGHLLRFMLSIPAVSSLRLPAGASAPFGLELESMEFRPVPDDVGENPGKGSS